MANSIETIKNKIRLLNQQLEQEQRKQNQVMAKSSEVESARQRDTKKLHETLELKQKEWQKIQLDIQKELAKVQGKYDEDTKAIQRESEMSAKKIADLLKQIADVQHELDNETRLQQKAT